MADYEIIASGAVGGGGSTNPVDLTSIPGTYKHLELMLTHKTTTTGNVGTELNFTFNDDTTSGNYCRGTNYTSNSSGAVGNSQRQGFGSGTGDSQDRLWEIATPPAMYTGSDANFFGYSRALFIGYSNTTLTKNVLIQSLTPGGYQPFTSTSASGLAWRIGAYGWVSTAAITKITMTMAAGSWDDESTYILAGIA